MRRAPLQGVWTVVRLNWPQFMAGAIVPFVVAWGARGLGLNSHFALGLGALNPGMDLVTRDRRRGGLVLKDNGSANNPITNGARILLTPDLELTESDPGWAEPYSAP